MTVAGVVLAAGFSRRFGRPKQRVTLLGEELLPRTVRTAVAAGLAPVLAVVQDAAWTAVLELLGATTVLNPRAAEGMATSVHCGVEAAALQGVSGIVLMTCDQPALTAAHLRALCAHPAEIAGSGYAGRTGVPAYFPAAAFPRLLALRGDAGARGLLQGVAVVAEESLALDVDTEEDVRRAKAWVARQRD